MYWDSSWLLWGCQGTPGQYDPSRVPKHSLSFYHFSASLSYAFLSSLEKTHWLRRVIMVILLNDLHEDSWKKIIDFEVNYDITVILTQNLSTYSDLFLINYLRITYNVFGTIHPTFPKFSYIYPFHSHFPHNFQFSLSPPPLSWFVLPSHYWE